MEKFSAVAFFNIGNILSAMELFYRAEKAKMQMSEGAKEVTLQRMAEMEEVCTRLNLRVPLKRITKIKNDLSMPGFTYEMLSTHVKNLSAEIQWEMEEMLFMHISQERAECFNKPDLLGKDVLAKFPALQYDITEAGNCYASGRSTAVVFHLMRIMETGVQEFGNKLGVALVNEKNWQNILDEINKQIKSLPKGPATVEMSQATANLYAVKLAWRNEVMHPKDTYTLEEADNLIRQVRIFMQQLAKII